MQDKTQKFNERKRKLKRNQAHGVVVVVQHRDHNEDSKLRTYIHPLALLILVFRTQHKGLALGAQDADWMRDAWRVGRRFRFLCRRERERKRGKKKEEEEEKKNEILNKTGKVTISLEHGIPLSINECRSAISATNQNLLQRQNVRSDILGGDGLIQLRVDKKIRKLHEI